jgi:hypothetical protein
MGLGFYRRQPIIYCKNEEIENNHKMMYALGFKKLQEYAQQNPKSFRRPDKLTEKECELLKECGFVGWKVWNSEEDWEIMKKQTASAALIMVPLKPDRIPQVQAC